MRKTNSLIPVFFDPTHKRWVGFVALFSASLLFVGFLLTTLSISIFHGPEVQSFALALPSNQAIIQTVAASADGKAGLSRTPPSPIAISRANKTAIAQIAAPLSNLDQPANTLLPNEDFFLAPTN